MANSPRCRTGCPTHRMPPACLTNHVEGLQVQHHGPLRMERGGGLAVSWLRGGMQVRLGLRALCTLTALLAPTCTVMRNSQRQVRGLGPESLMYRLMSFPSALSSACRVAADAGQGWLQASGRGMDIMWLSMCQEALQFPHLTWMVWKKCTCAPAGMKWRTAMGKDGQSASWLAPNQAAGRQCPSTQPENPLKES